MEAKPSDFIKRGFPFCSIFGETWHEMTAVTYLQALVVNGDEWKVLSPDEVSRVMDKVPVEELQPGLGSILANKGRIICVADKLKSAEDARNFSLVWMNVGK